jgi:hypothetical protein
VIEVMTRICEELAKETGRPTRLVRYENREDIAVFKP